ncbi:hypothetical protein E2C01_054498 [Portunus trituberculatus]|uniref:Secreted protein n=1 Tax=Portunus trituberculatus TaxID=210409 RepID=A0A5B7GS83_PORTR|nr:hypothetical protein [Portunus trituberculatus]
MAVVVVVVVVVINGTAIARPSPGIRRKQERRKEHGNSLSLPPPGPHSWVNVRISLNFSAHSRHLFKLTTHRPLHSSQLVITDRPHTETTDSRVRVRYGQVRGCGWVAGGRRGVWEVVEGEERFNGRAEHPSLQYASSSPTIWLTT